MGRESTSDGGGGRVPRAPRVNLHGLSHRGVRGRRAYRCLPAAVARFGVSSPIFRWDGF